MFMLLILINSLIVESHPVSLFEWKNNVAFELSQVKQLFSELNKNIVDSNFIFTNLSLKTEDLSDCKKYEENSNSFTSKNENFFEEIFKYIQKLELHIAFIEISNKETILFIESSNIEEANNGHILNNIKKLNQCLNFVWDTFKISIHDEIEMIDNYISNKNDFSKEIEITFESLQKSFQVLNSDFENLEQILKKIDIVLLK